MTKGTVEPRLKKASVRSVFTPHRAALVVASTGALTLGAWALSALIQMDQVPSEANIATLAPMPSATRHTEPAPQVWLSSLVGVTSGPFSDPSYAIEPVLPRVTRALPPLPPRPVVPEVSAVPQVPVVPEVAAAPVVVQPAPVAEPAETVAAQPVELPTIVAPTGDDIIALASLRAPRRSLIPVARPQFAVAAAPVVAPIPEIVDSAPILAIATSRTPAPRPEAVTRLATASIAAPILTQPRREPLSVPPLTEAIARNDRCESSLTRAIPRRSGRSGDGSAVIGQLTSVSGSARDNAIVHEVVQGNIPDFMRNLVPVTFTGQGGNGQRMQVTICVMPDYLAVGSNSDYVRVPLGLPAATRIAERFDMILPTTRMVDAIYSQASVRLSPSPMQPGSQMASTDYFMRHNATVEGQRAQASRNLGLLVSGHKKDLVLTNRLDRNPGRVAIYGWHRRSGSPIQPLSTVHGAQYADYSHGIRLVARRAYVNGRAVDLRDLLADSRLAGLVSSEGTISNRQMLASLR
jgi:hypothetical protein